MKVDSFDATANYKLGVIYLLGLGCEKDILKALEYFEVAKSDAHALNAIGVIHYLAPDVFETDPVKLYPFGKIRRDLKKSVKSLEEAAEKGNLNARYNLGVIHLDDTLVPSKFSLGRAYDYFKSAASKGHTLSSYNLGVMNYLGFGTYKSCKVALTFFKHINTVGEQAQILKRAHKMAEVGKYVQSAFIYMELAE